MQNRTYIVAAAAVAAAVIFFGATKSPAAEQFNGSQGTGGNRVIRVSGTAVVYGKPDYATIELGVTKLAPKVMDAKSACDASMKRVQDALKKAGVQADDIQTTNFQIYPVQVKNAPRQWKVAHSISVKVRKVASVAGVLDVAVESGATDISQVSYALEKILDLRTKARAEAVKVARAKAQELADLNGVRLGDPLTISDSSYEGGYAQTYANSSMDYSASPAAINPNVMSGGQIAVNAREDVEFAIR